MEFSLTDIANTAAKEAGVTQAQARKTLDAILEAVRVAVKGRHKVVFVNFGVFEHKTVKAGLKHNPKNMQKVYKAEFIRPHFRSADAFRKYVKED